MNKVLKNILYFFFAILIAKFMGAFKSLYVVKYLEPSEYGNWVTLMVISSLAGILTLGTGECMQKMVPFYIGKGMPGKAREVEKGVLGSIFISFVMLLVVGSVFHLFLDPDTDKLIIGLVRVMLIATAIRMLSAFFTRRFEAHQDFREVSLINAAMSILIFIFLVFFSWEWGLKGTVWGYLTAFIIIFCLTFSLNRIKYGPVGISFNMKLIGSLIKIGFPITIVWWIYHLQTTADRIISRTFLGDAQTGYYGLGMNLVSVFILVPRAIGRVLYPKINELYGQTENKHDLVPLVIAPTRLLGVFMPYMAALLLVLTPLVYYTLRPNYAPGITSAQILILGIFFISTIRNGTNYLIAINKQSKFLKYVLISLTLNITGNITLIKLGYGIEGIAFSTTFAGAVLATMIWWAVYRDIGYSGFDLMKNLISQYLPSLILAVLFIGFRIVMGCSKGVFDLRFILASGGLFVSYTIIVFVIPLYRKWAGEAYRLFRSGIKRKSFS